MNRKITEAVKVDKRKIVRNLKKKLTFFQRTKLEITKSGNSSVSGKKYLTSPLS